MTLHCALSHSPVPAEPPGLKTRPPGRRRTPLVALLAAIAAGVFIQGQAPTTGPDLSGALRWRYIGPEGNRVSAIAGIPGDPLIYYAGSASGGIAKTTDGGTTWTQIFDDQPVQSIGDIAVTPLVLDRTDTASLNHLSRWISLLEEKR